MRTNRIVLALAGILFAAACLPSRNNHFDPDSAPNVQAGIVEITHAGPCPSVLSSSLQDVGSATRLDCLGIDARDTVDPSGPGAHLTFSYYYPGENVAFLTTDSGLVVIDPAWLAAQDPAPLVFRVRAKNDRGYVGEGTATIVLQDIPPVAVVNAPRSLPLGGTAWAGSTLPVFFDASQSYDPDETSVRQYCWSFDGGAETCSSDVEDPAFVRPINLLAHHRTVGSLVVVDQSGQRSRRVTTSVDVTNPSAWLAGGVNGDTAVARMDNGATGPGPLGRAPASVAFVGTAMLITSSQATGTIHQWDWLSLTDLQSGTPAFGATLNAVSIAVDAASGTIFTVADYTNTLAPELNTWTLDGALVGGTPIPLPGGPATFPQYSSPVIAIDQTGDAWITGPAPSTVFWQVHDPTGTASVTTITLDTGRALTGLASRPGTDETWAIETRDYLDPASASIGSAALLVFHAQGNPGVATPERYPLSADVAKGIGWVDATEFWIAVEGEGVHLVDANAFLQSGSIDAASVLFLPAPDVVGISVDSGTGECWVFPSAGTVSVIGLDGHVREMQAAVSASVATDPDGARYFYAGAFLAKGFAPGAGVVAERHFAGTADVRFDPATGGLWAIATNPPALLHLGIDATIDERVAKILTTDLNGNTAEAPLVPVFPWFVSRDGAFAYGVQRDLSSPTRAEAGLVRFDLSTNPPSARQVLDATDANVFTGYLSGNSHLVGLGSPSTGTPFFWAYDDSLKRFLVLDTAGQASGAFFALPAAESTKLPTGAVLDGSGSACVGTVDNVTPSQTARLRVVTRGGTATLLQAFTVANTTNASGFVQGVSAAATQGGESCWIAYSCNDADSTCLSGGVGARVVGYTTGGALIHTPISIHNGFYVFGMTATSEDDVWVYSRNNGTFTNSYDHYTWNAVNGAWDDAQFLNLSISNLSRFATR